MMSRTEVRYKTRQDATVIEYQLHRIGITGDLVLEGHW